MIVAVKSGEYISDEVLEKIKNIFSESNCPNESFKSSLENFSYFDGETVQLVEGENFCEYLEVFKK